MRRGAPARRPLANPPSSTATGNAPEQIAVRVWVRLLAVHKRGLAAIRDDLEKQMTLPRFDLLANLVRADGQTLASLSRSMLVTAGNLTGLVDRAARDGLVERRSDPNDRRAWRVHMTPKGVRAFNEAERRHAQKVSKLFSGLTPAELETIILLLDKVKATLREAEPEPQLFRGMSGRKTQTRAPRPTRRAAIPPPGLPDKKKRPS